MSHVNESLLSVRGSSMRSSSSCRSTQKTNVRPSTKGGPRNDFSEFYYKFKTNLVSKIKVTMKPSRDSLDSQPPFGHQLSWIVRDWGELRGLTNYYKKPLVLCCKHLSILWRRTCCPPLKSLFDVLFPCEEISKCGCRCPNCHLNGSEF